MDIWDPPTPAHAMFCYQVKCCYEHLCTIFVGLYVFISLDQIPKSRMAGFNGSVCLILKEVAKNFSKLILSFYIPKKTV